jgi:ketopantoate reductase
MSDNLRPHILIIGAGSMGIITGYHLTLSGAEVTFLIRPHRKEALDRPQILYCYDDNQLKEYTGNGRCVLRLCRDHARWDRAA